MTATAADIIPVAKLLIAPITDEERSANIAALLPLLDRYATEANRVPRPDLADISDVLLRARAHAHATTPASATAWARISPNVSRCGRLWGMLLLLLLALSSAHAANCPTLGAEPVKLTTVAAACLGDETKVYAVRRDGDSFWVKRLSLVLTPEQRAQAKIVGAELKASALDAKRVYLMWDPPTATGAAVKLLVVNQTFEALQ